MHLLVLICTIIVRFWHKQFLYDYLSKNNALSSINALYFAILYSYFLYCQIIHNAIHKLAVAHLAKKYSE